MQNNAHNRLIRQGRLLAAILGIALALAPTGAAQAALQLVDNSASVWIDPDAPSGVYDWIVSGQDQLAAQWWWVEVDGQRFSVDALGPAAVTQPTANRATTLYTDAVNGFSVEISFELTGTSFASAESLLKESVVIQNDSGSLLDISLFMYNDFDLGGTPTGDAAWLRGINDGQFPFPATVGWLEAGQVDGIYTNTVIYNGYPQRAEIGTGTALLDKLNNTLDDLSLNAGDLPNTNDGSSSLYGPEGPGDVNYAIQWDFSIAAGDSDGVALDKRLVTPEPGTAVLGLIGLLVIGLMRNKRKLLS